MNKLFAKLLLPCLLMCGMASAQRSNVTSFAPLDDHDSDVVALSSLAPTINLSLLPKPSGTLPGSLTLTSPQACTEVLNGASYDTFCGTTGNGATPVPLAQFYFIPQEMMGMTAGATYSTVSPCFYTTVTRLIGADGVSSYHIPSTQVSTTCTPNSATVTTDDGTGLTATLTASSATTPPNVTPVYNASGWKYTALSASSFKVADAFGNAETLNTSFTDTLGAATTVTGSPLTSLKYNDVGGTQRTISFVSGTQTTFQPLCGQHNAGTSVTPVTSISLPDGTSYGFTWDTNNSGIDGLIKSYTLRTGGTISFTYGSVLTCNGSFSMSSLKRTTPDGDTNYSLSQNTTTGITTTTVLDAGKNKVVYTMWGIVPGDIFTQSISRYQNTGSVGTPAYTEISSTSYCYNAHISDCATYVPAYPITQLDTYEYRYNGATQVAMSHDVKQFDSYGNVTSDANTDSITSQTLTTTTVYGTDSSGTCVAITNTAVVNHPCTVTTKNGSTWLSGNTYSYNSNGALTSSSKCLSSTCTGSSALTTTYTPTTQGTYSVIQDPNGQNTNYTYGSCNSLLPTDVTTTVNSVAIDNKATWNCDAGVKTDTTDANSNEDDTAYDLMDRIHTYNDRTGDTNTTTYTYGTPTLDHVETVDPLSVTKYQYVDSLGRPSVNQVYNGTNYDTIGYTRGWNGTNFQTNTYGYCTSTLGNGCSLPSATSTVYANPIAGPTSTSNVNGGTGTYAIKGRDTSFTAGPAPSGENTKVVQTEVDGFGRTSSVCALTSSGYNGRVACGQTMGGNGTLTSSTYSFPSAGVTETQTTRGSQTHTVKTDAVRRVTSVQTPEAGTFTKVYDSIAANYCFTGSAASSSAGDLVGTTDAASNKVCMYYDGLHRLTDVGNSNQGTTNYCKRFRFDSTANKFVSSAPSGYPSSGNNIIGRMFEAETDNCASTPVTITDEWFAYDVMGRMTDKWQSSTNSGGYYHTTFAYDADGTLTSLSVPSFSTVTYGLDGEERPNSMTYGATTIVSATAGSGFKYDAAGKPTNVPIGSGTNQDTRTYDQLENMLTYTFPVGTKSDAGTLTWNAIGSLGKLVINDTVPSSTDSQTCAYGYDDVARLTSAATISGSTCNAAQTFGYDQYDNMWQSGAFSNGCSTCYSSTNNEQTGTPTLTYDSDGNVKSDTTNTYTWNVYGKLASSVAGGTAATCGSSGVCYVYDALGMLVEQQENGFNRQHLYGAGSLPIALMNGQTAIWALVPAPGGGLLWVNSGTNYYAHTDWLGTVRLTTVASSNSVLTDQAMTPYGREYDVLGSAFNIFAGDLTDDTGLWFTPTRSFPPYAARWLSADPAHAGWNAYAYPTDPNRQTDPTGLSPLTFNQIPESWQSTTVYAGQEDLRGTDWIAIAHDKMESQLDAIALGNWPGLRTDECPQCLLMASAFFKFSSKMTPEDVEFNTSQIPFAKDELENLINQRSNQEQLIRDLRDSYNRTKDIMTDAQRINAYTEQYEANAEAMRLSAAISDLDADIARAERGFGGAGSGAVNGLMPFLFLEGGLLNPTNTGRDDRSVPHFWGPGDNAGSWVAPIQTLEYINSVLQNINNQQIHWPQ